jgi:hypothetical protein
VSFQLLCSLVASLLIVSRWIEWVYVIDLDRELFHVSTHSYLCLSNLPKNLEEVLGVSANFHISSAVRARLAWAIAVLDQTNAAGAGITTNILPPSSGNDGDSSAYFDLQPSMVVPKWSRKLDQRPFTTVARHTLNAMLEENAQLISQAQYAAPRDDFIFRETAFTILCICSCSPELLRITTRTNQTHKTMDAPFAMFKPSFNSLDGPEFASAAFSGYLLQCKQ